MLVFSLESDEIYIVCFVCLLLGHMTRPGSSLTISAQYYEIFTDNKLQQSYAFRIIAVQS